MFVKIVKMKKLSTLRTKNVQTLKKCAWNKITPYSKNLDLDEIRIKSILNTYSKNILKNYLLKFLLKLNKFFYEIKFL